MCCSGFQDTDASLSSSSTRSKTLANDVLDSLCVLVQGVGKLAAGIAVKSPVAAFGTKRICVHSREHTVADGLQHVAVWNSAQLVSADMHEAFSAMKERRAPQYAAKL